MNKYSFFGQLLNFNFQVYKIIKLDDQNDKNFYNLLSVKSYLRD
jgi:hypothetical protein